MMNDSRNGSEYICVQPVDAPILDIFSDPTFLYVPGEYNT